MKEKDVEREYIQEMKEILEEAEEKGMQWFPRLVVLGKYPH
ncbi:MAG: hypothetical protein BTN85_1252 [Candidatus Methanohalarchaeum thermophilum]|uniref:Uncharacterized protein n=1 Tax=Methanohalarchaeum thermophilum TaxID=1903181 RepID=A0A1Q6DWN2_METT1|nr:MAG: hypothetical protein BTN85_1252 [Candidatus Methanohalarchaeum thermophilum]